MTISHVTRRSGSLILTATALVTLTLGATACAGSVAAPASTSASSQQKQQQNGGSSGHGRASTANGGGQKSSVGEFTVAFAKCMRAHGVPKFPNPNGQPGQLGPNSGVNIMSPAFQATVNGPCRSLAPAEWVQSGPGQNSPGGGG